MHRITFCKYLLHIVSVVKLRAIFQITILCDLRLVFVVIKLQLIYSLTVQKGQDAPEHGHALSMFKDKPEIFVSMEPSFTKAAFSRKFFEVIRMKGNSACRYWNTGSVFTGNFKYPTPFGYSRK